MNKLSQFLQQAQQIGIMSDDHSYIIMNPDLQTIDIEPYKHGGSNITGGYCILFNFEIPIFSAFNSIQLNISLVFSLMLGAKCK